MTNNERIDDATEELANPQIDAPAATEVTSEDVAAEATPPDVTIPILPLRGTVVFPLTVVPLAAAQARSLRLIDEVMSGDRLSAWSCRMTPSWKAPAQTMFKSIGTIGSILQMMRVPDGSVRLAVQGNERMQHPGMGPGRAVPGRQGRAACRKRSKRSVEVRGADAQYAGALPAAGLAGLAPAG